MDKKSLAVSLSDMSGSGVEDREVHDSTGGLLHDDTSHTSRHAWSDQRLDISNWRLGEGQQASANAMTIDMKYSDLCPSDSGEVVFEVDGAFHFNISDASKVSDYGVCTSHQESADGADVSSYRFMVLEDGVTIYYPAQVHINI